MAAYQENVDAANDLALDSTPLAKPLLELLNDRGRWNGRAVELLTELNNRADEQTKRQRTWPTQPKSLTGAIKRLAPNLRASGWDAQYHRTDSKRFWTIEKIPIQASFASSASFIPANGSRHDANDDADANTRPPTTSPEANRGEWEEGAL